MHQNKTSLVTRSGQFGQSVCDCHIRFPAVEPVEIDLIRVVYNQSPRSVLTSYRDESTPLPGNVGLLVADDQADPGSTDATIRIIDNTTIKMTTVSPTDLTGLGIQFTQLLTDVAETGNQTVVCFDSITALLQFVDFDSAYKYLSTMTSQLRTKNIVSYFHLSPSAHDQIAHSRLKQLFGQCITGDS